MRYYLGNVYAGRALRAIGIDTAAWLVACAALPGAPLHGAIGLAALAATGATGAALAVVLFYAGAYDLKTLCSRNRTLRALATAAGLAAGALLLSGIVAPLSGRALGSAALQTAVFFLLALPCRVALAHAFARGRTVDRILLVGASDLSRTIATAIGERPRLGSRIVGYVSDDPSLWHRAVDGIPVRGQVHEIGKVIDEQRVRRVVVTSKRRNEAFPAEELLAAKLRGVSVESGVDFYERLTGRIYMRDLRPSYLIFSSGVTPHPRYIVAKRLLDVCGAVAGLLLASPLLLAAMIAVRIDTPGPFFFVQDRIGQWGRPIRVFKLRSMVDRAEDATGATMALRDDPRVTRVGAFLRRSRLDELPQLWNVLRGNMSLVGPRPERPEFAPGLSDRYAYFQIRCAAKPGLTGWAQIRQGYVSDEFAFEDKLALDLYYLKHRSLWMDAVILAKTLKTVLLLRGL